MKRRMWDRYAPVYRQMMRGDRKAYEYLYERTAEKVRDRDVLEIAAGPGMLARHIAPAARSVVATDYSVGMILEAEKGDVPDNLKFEVADAAELPYKDSSFDVVIVSNALHVMDDPDRALKEIRRVLRPDGLLIAPDFVNHSSGSLLWTSVLKFASTKFRHHWNGITYPVYLMSRGWDIVFCRTIQAHIPVLYTECVPAEGSSH